MRKKEGKILPWYYNSNPNSDRFNILEIIAKQFDRKIVFVVGENLGERISLRYLNLSFVLTFVSTNTISVSIKKQTYVLFKVGHLVLTLLTLAQCRLSVIGKIKELKNTNISFSGTRRYHHHHHPRRRQRRRRHW